MTASGWVASTSAVALLAGVVHAQDPNTNSNGECCTTSNGDGSLINFDSWKKGGSKKKGELYECKTMGSDDSLTYDEEVQLQDLCKDQLESPWFTTLINCVVRRVVVTCNHAVKRFAINNPNAMLIYAMDMEKISADFSVYSNIPMPEKGDEAKAATMCMQAAYNIMVSASQRVYDASVMSLRARGMRDFLGPWGWREGTCFSTADIAFSGDETKNTAMKAMKYAKAKLEQSQKLREAANDKDHCYKKPWWNYFSLFVAAASKVTNSAGTAVTGQKLTGDDDANSIQIRSDTEGMCFQAILTDVSSWDVMRTAGGNDQIQIDTCTGDLATELAVV